MKTSSKIIATLSAAALLAIGACATNTGARSDQAQPFEADGPKTETVTLLFIADLHAQLAPHPELFWRDGEEDRLEIAGGFARVASAIEYYRQARDGRVIVLDGGDTLQGSGHAALSEGAAIIEPMNALGLDAAIPGNWEVAYGPQVLTDRLGELDYEIFVANLRDEATGERLFPPTYYHDVGNLRVAIIGYTDPDVPERQPPAYSRGLAYDGPEELPQLVEEARREGGADLVVLLSHIGLAKAVALTDHVPGIDIHLSSDTHERTYEPIDQNGVWVVEPGAFGSFLGVLDLTVQNGEIVDQQWELVELTAEAFDEDPEVRAIVDRATAIHGPELEAIVGHTSSMLSRHNVIETTLDHLLADALRDVTGTEIALSNGFRFGNPLPPGPIKEADLWNFYPVVTNLKIGKVTGQQLLDFWERELENVFARDASKRFGGWVPRPSGMQLTFTAANEPGDRVQELLIQGEPVEPARLYSITACEREGEPDHVLCRIPHAVDTEIISVDAHEAVRMYLRKHDHVHRDLEERVRATDLPGVLRSQF